MVRTTKSQESAKIVAKYFQSTRDYRSVIEFCLLAGLGDEALSYAQVIFPYHLLSHVVSHKQNNNQMEFYAQQIEKTADPNTRKFHDAHFYYSSITIDSQRNRYLL